MRSVKSGFAGLNVLYNDEGRIEYPVDDAGQLYVPLRFWAQAADRRGQLRREIDKGNKKLKKAYATRVATDWCHIVFSSHCKIRKKKRKTLRECCKYLKDNRLDRTQFWRRVGDVLVCNVEALEHAMEKSVGQQPPKGKVVGCCRNGAAYPSRDKRGGDHMARRAHQRVNRDRSRDDCILSCALARALNPLQGGSAPRNTERPVSNCSSCNHLLLIGLKKGNLSDQRRIKQSMLGYPTQLID